MKRKFLTLIVAAVTALTCIFGFTACANGNGENTDGSGANDGGTREEVWGEVYTIKAAYAKATSLGYTGSLEEFIETISGKDGKVE